MYKAFKEVGKVLLKAFVVFMIMIVFILAYAGVIYGGMGGRIPAHTEMISGLFMLVGVLVGIKVVS